MTDLMAARSQMALSLAFHMIFAVVGMAMPLLMVIAEWRYLQGGDRRYLVLARRWAKGTGIMFAVGAVSGTVLSFELGLLWPRFMELAGPAVGMPFSMEGFAFFMEAIFLGIFLYGWERVSPRMHLFSAVMVLVSGVASGVFVVCANAWMNTPTGITFENGRIVDVDPVAAMFNPAAFSQTTHMVVGAFEALGFAVAGVHAWLLLKNPGDWLHQRALAIALSVGGCAALLQPLTGDLCAVQVAENQPAKLAAMEGHWETQKGAPITLGGWASDDEERTLYGIDIPYVLSIMAFRDPNATVRGLKDFPKEDRPPAGVVHLAFDLMVGCGMVLLLVTILEALMWRRRKPWEDPRRLKLLALCTPLGMIAVEAGWTVTEVGRQPWVIQGVMRTKDAVTNMPGLQVTFVTFTLVYLLLWIVVVTLMRKLVFASLQPAERSLVGGTMSLELALAGFMVISLTVYALSGGADFGGGVWDLFARGPRAKTQRDIIAHAVGPIWEANHVWLIAVVVVLFSAFPTAYALISTALHIPLTLMLLGIVMRGSAFVFRSQVPPQDVEYRRWSVVFAVSSIVTPIMLGICLGAVASGRVQSPVSDFLSAWTGPFPVAIGAMTLALFAFLAAVYLTLESDDVAIQDDFRRRALAAGAAVFVCAWVALAFAAEGAPLLYEGLLQRAWSIPLQILIAMSATGAIVALWRRRFSLARFLAMAQVSLMVWGWALSQHPFLIVPQVTLTSAAAPRSVLIAVGIALIVGTTLLVPALGYLYFVFKGHHHDDAPSE